MRLIGVVTLFVVFTAYSASVMVQHGVIGFLMLAGREAWGLQMLLDLLLMLGLFSLWLAQDAKRWGLPRWPHIVLTMVMGSVGALVYLIHRELLRKKLSRAGALPSVQSS